MSNTKFFPERSLCFLKNLAVDSFADSQAPHIRRGLVNSKLPDNRAPTSRMFGGCLKDMKPCCRWVFVCVQSELG